MSATTTETTPAAAGPAAASPVPEVEGHRPMRWCWRARWPARPIREMGGRQEGRWERALMASQVYVGNLAFTATEEQVKEHFDKVGGEIVSVILPTRHKSRRPAGYAFVTFKDEADANKAVETLNETEIGERKIQLEVARSKEENAERKSVILEKRREAKATKEPKEAQAADAAAETSEDKSADKADKPKKKSAKKAGRRRGPEDGDDAAEAEATGEAAPAATKTRKARAPKQPKEGANGDEAAEKKAKAEPAERKPRLQLTGETSKTTVFVANLPFTIDDEGLSALFTDLSIKVKTAHVIRGLRRLPGRRPFRGSKGFGFVELDDPTQQQEAVEKINGSAIGDRTITAKIAQEMKPIEEIQAEADKADAEAEKAETAAAA
ncbi:uncharacterized protein EHS24_007984 [Apiotrichum porosum]|uniref:RRM domain-containing protein n=1 Tax=Apiotrichum porosum TaxID=105984 RepID=A0A427XS91_9TREE|nr:uncharacterized protein EHS24_007984 [Apiotrichum porosum]RSH81792.1 hypothetical protein EHS24_007984 [Apiotrichum porosum]